MTLKAWTGTGHMITAQIAYWQLSNEARAEADRLIALLAQFEPRADHAVPASVWMDDLKSTGFRAMNTWHYINIPHNAGALTEVPPARDENVVWAIEEATETFENPRATDFNKAFMLRILLHLVGDIHQPLHTVGRCTQEHPGGDRGGNDFRILDGREDISLHFYWDRTADLFPRVRAADWRQAIPALSRQVTLRVPKENLPTWQETSPAAWARESFHLAVHDVYPGLEPLTSPSEAYTAHAQSVIVERLALGGYRLGALLERLLLLSTQEPSSQSPSGQSTPLESAGRP